MPTQFEVLLYVKLPLDIEAATQRVFGALGGGEAKQTIDENLGGECWRLEALGLQAALFANEGDMLDEDFPDFQYGLSVMSTFHCADIEMAPVEPPLADYYARLLAFYLDAETATSFYVGSHDGVDLYEVRSFRRNTQFRSDAGPTTPRVYVSERRTVEYASDESDANSDDEFEDTALEDEE